jgi:hypothetical protein
MAGLPMVQDNLVFDSHSGACYRNLAGKQSFIISPTDSHFEFTLEKLGKVGKELDMLQRRRVYSLKTGGRSVASELGLRNHEGFTHRRQRVRWQPHS